MIEILQQLRDKLESSSSSATAPETYLDVIILEVSEEATRIGHLGQVFEPETSNILRVEDPPRAVVNDFAAGAPARIFLNADAVVQQIKRYAASDLMRGLPYVLSQPSSTGPLSGDPYPQAHEDYLSARGVASSPSPERATQTYTASQCQRDTTRYTTDPLTGSTRVDGIDNDGYYRDDSSPDGFTNDPDLNQYGEFTALDRATTDYTRRDTRRDTTRYTTDPQTGSTRVDGIDNDGYTADGFDPDGLRNDPG